MSSIPQNGAHAASIGHGTAQSTATDAMAGFATDPRIHFSKVTGKWEFEDDDGNEMEWDMAKQAWVPVVDEELVKQQQAGYSVAGVDEETPVAAVLARASKKRKVVDYTSNTIDDPLLSGPPKKKGKHNDASSGNGTTTSKNAPPKPTVSKNTAVYVTGLPHDATAEEIAERFSRCGVLMEDDVGDPKIKMYANDKGEFNGEALVVYFMEDSVMLALNILDEAELRIGDASTRMSVKKGEFGHKDPGAGGAPHPPRRVVDKKKATQRIHKMKNKLTEWGPDDGFGPMEDAIETQGAPVTSRVVVLKHMFTLDELKEDPSLLLDLKEDVREEAESLGDVTNVVLYDLEPDGVMTLKFRDPISAQACVIKFDGRFFAGRRIEATLFAGKQRFKRSGGGGGEQTDDGEGGEAHRLADFEKWLLAEGETGDA